MIYIYICNIYIHIERMYIGIYKHTVTHRHIYIHACIIDVEARLPSPRANSPSWVAVACLKWELRLSWGVVSFPRKKQIKHPIPVFFSDKLCCSCG